MKIGVLCPSEIALRRFMPALIKTNFRFIGLAINSPYERFGTNLPKREIVESMLELESSKAKVFIDLYGGKYFYSYNEIINSPEIDALYIPLPPGLHFKWAKRALEAGKHVLIEKPSTTSFADTNELVSIARNNGLALHENYMFSFHSQLEAIDQIIKNRRLGDIRLFSIKFGFPMRSCNDFRYIKSLGGGALMDAGGYCIKLATRLLGSNTRIEYARLNFKNNIEVDIFGSGALVNDKGLTAQIAFGMDNDYKCELEIWGSIATLKTGRILTAPVGYEPILQISQNGKEDVIKLSSDDTFEKSILKFQQCIDNENIRNNTYNEILTQSSLVEEFIRKADL